MSLNVDNLLRARHPLCGTVTIVCLLSHERLWPDIWKLAMLVNVKITITFDTNSSTISVTDFVRNFSIHLTFFLDVTPNILNIWSQIDVVLQCEEDTRRWWRRFICWQRPPSRPPVDIKQYVWRLHCVVTQSLVTFIINTNTNTLRLRDQEGLFFSIITKTEVGSSLPPDCWKNLFRIIEETDIRSAL